jgi:hypothetical protein
MTRWTRRWWTWRSPPEKPKQRRGRRRGQGLVPADRHERSLSVGDVQTWPIGEKRSLLLELDNSERIRLTFIRTGDRSVAVQARGGLDLDRLVDLPWSPLVPKAELDAYREGPDLDEMSDGEATEATARVLARLEARG